MDRDTAVARIQARLGFRTDLTATIQNALQDEQDELERGASLPWFLLQEDQTFTITPAVPASATPREFTLPSGFIKEADEKDGGQLRFQQTAPGPTLFVQKMDLKPAELFFFNRKTAYWQDDVEIIVSEDTQFTPGAPIAYVLRNTTVRIYPGPDQTYNLLWSYYVHDVVLNASNVSNNGWLTYLSDVLISGAGIRASEHARDADARTYFENWKAKAVQSAIARGVERERADRDYSMGSML